MFYDHGCVRGESKPKKVINSWIYVCSDKESNNSENHNLVFNIKARNKNDVLNDEAIMDEIV